MRPRSRKNGRRRAVAPSRARPRSVLPMNMWELWPSPAKYWDLVERAIDESPMPYFAFVMRSGPPDQGSTPRVREVFEYLPQHRLSKKLAFVDPLTLADLPAGASALAKV